MEISPSSAAISATGFVLHGLLYVFVSGVRLQASLERCISWGYHRVSDGSASGRLITMKRSSKILKLKYYSVLS